MPRVARRKPLDANIGVVSVGLDTYWKTSFGISEHKPITSISAEVIKPGAHASVAQNTLTLDDLLDS